jgi:peptide-methionine (R)-S-oxide reductase
MVSLRDYSTMTKIKKTEQDLRSELTPEQYRILREKGTEAPFSGEYDFSVESGT